MSETYTPAIRVFDRSCDLPSAGRYRQRSFDHPLTKMAGAHAVGRKFLAGQMDQPDVALQLAGLAEFQKRFGPQHQGRRGRMVVVGAGGSQPRTMSAMGVTEHIFHVGRVVMIGHDHRSGAIAAGNRHQQIALVSFLASGCRPSPPSTETETRSASETEPRRQSLCRPCPIGQSACDSNRANGRPGLRGRVPSGPTLPG